MTELQSDPPKDPDSDDPREIPEDDKPDILIKLQERKKRHETRGLPARIGVVVLGVVLVLGGIVLSGPGVPGPGFLVVLLGLSFLALEFDRAERLLEKVIVWADNAKDRAEAMTNGQKAFATFVALLLFAAFVLWAVFYDIPLVPVI